MDAWERYFPSKETLAGRRDLRRRIREAETLAEVPHESAPDTRLGWPDYEDKDRLLRAITLGTLVPERVA